MTPRPQRLLWPVLFIILGIRSASAQAGANDPSFRTFDTGFGQGDGFDDYTYCVAMQPDGKCIVGGDFHHFESTIRHRMARLDENGSLDPSFDPGTGPNDVVLACAVQPDGKILIGGSFTVYDGIVRNHIARLNADGSLDLGFAAGSAANGAVRSIALDADGNVLIGGSFYSYNGTSQAGLAKLSSANGSLDGTFAVGSGASGVYSVLAQPDGKVVAGGSFVSFNGAPCGRIVRLDADGAIDASFQTGTGANTVVRAMALRSDGRIVVGGSFSSFNGYQHAHLVQLEPDGSLDTLFGWGQEPDDDVIMITLQGNGGLIIAGWFSHYGQEAIDGFTRLFSIGLLDPSFENAGYSVEGVVEQPDGKLILVGEFGSYDQFPRGSIVRIESDGSLDMTFDAQVGPALGWVYKVIVQPDGKILLQGDFDTFDGEPNPSLVRLEPDGHLDTAFSNAFHEQVTPCASSLALQSDGRILTGCGLQRLHPDGSSDTTLSVPDVQINVMLQQPDGKILIGCDPFFFNGVAISGVARFGINGDLDTAFTLNINPGSGSGHVFVLARQPDGKILVAGDFHEFNGLPFCGITRLETDGTLDPSFLGPGSSDWIFTDERITGIALQPDGKILIGGGFADYGDVEKAGFARLNPDGTLDMGFTCGPTGAGYHSASEIDVQPDGKIIAGGLFTEWAGSLQRRLIRLNPDGSGDPDFSVGFGANSSIFDQDLQPDGNLVIVGDFTAYQNIGRNHVARVFTDIALGDEAPSVVTPGVRVWPNPNDGNELFFSVSMFDAPTVLELEFRDLLGRRILKRSMMTIASPMRQRCSLAGALPQGSYLLTISYGDQRTTTKLVVR